MENNNNNPHPFYFEIERLIERRETDHGTEYLVKWKDYPEEQNTWEPLKNLIEDHAEEAICFFEAHCNETPPKDVTLFLISYKGIRLNKNNNNHDSEELESDEDINKMEEDWMNAFGSFPKDSVKRIIKLEKNHRNQEVYAEVEWNIRELTGFKPPNSFVKTSKLKKYCLKLYLYFLEDIMFTDKEIKREKNYNN